MLRQALIARNIEPVEAGGELQPGKFAFCTKICSKIITSQFCIAIVNNDIIEEDGKRHERPNANVNIEYDLMLGHNKYIIPFQRSDQQLPFNVAGLDTIKYEPKNFAELAGKAIDQAIRETAQEKPVAQPIDQLLGTYLLMRNAIVLRISGPIEQTILGLGSPCGFSVLLSFDGLRYTYFGNFSALRTDAIILRLNKPKEILDARAASLDQRKELGLTTSQQENLAKHFWATLAIWVLVTHDQQRDELRSWAEKNKLAFQFDAFTVDEVTASVTGLTV